MKELRAMMLRLLPVHFSPLRCRWLLAASLVSLAAVPSCRKEEVRPIAPPKQAVADTWENLDARGLKMKFPGPMREGPANIPVELRQLVSDSSNWKGKWDGWHASVAYTRYRREGIMTVQSSFDNVVRGMHAFADRVSVKDTPTDVSGRPAVEARFSFTLKDGKKSTGYMMTVMSGRELWQIQLLREGEDKDGIDKKLKESMRFD